MRQLSQALQHLHRVLPPVAGDLGPGLDRSSPRTWRGRGGQSGQLNETVTPEVLLSVGRSLVTVGESKLVTVGESKE
ncbi:hypothetical protein BC936DRAFT_142723 [Jimgerdemannia flammicorona]|uniref:Uncharacterized protein n=1 Tax=Jimgerdemannia flammicorona TaxID=994334 RepID=A0A433DEV6_9FUNG|nr:hypothetical protein BC936DRAFT_142723 [Jimgerdemannia flammicorona]